jgi:hypothetical protein
MTQVVEHLPSKNEALYQYHQKKKRRKKKSFKQTKELNVKIKG